MLLELVIVTGDFHQSNHRAEMTQQSGISDILTEPLVVAILALPVIAPIELLKLAQNQEARGHQQARRLRSALLRQERHSISRG